jgi:hypothetical protein
MIRLTPGERLVLATILVVGLVLLVACGGGSGEAAAAPDRKDLLFGYFGDCDTCVAETRGHANIAMVMGWGAPGAMERHAVEAVAAKQQILLAVCWACGAENLRWQFGVLRAAGVLSEVVALYPVDEPDVAGLTAAQVAALCALVRQVAAEYPELAGVALAAIYGSVGTEGIEQFDWIGRDFYGHGAIVPIRQPWQRLILVPGGADPWREDPTAFIETANRTPAVVLILPFIWRDPTFGRGIATNGLGQTYCRAGVRVTGRTGPCA